MLYLAGQRGGGSKVVLWILNIEGEFADMSTENFRLCQVRGSEDLHIREHERSGIILVSYNQIALYMPGVYTPIIHVFLHCPWCSQQENGSTSGQNQGLSSTYSSSSPTGPSIGRVPSISKYTKELIGCDILVYRT